MTPCTCAIKVSYDPAFERWVVWLLGPSNVPLAFMRSEAEAREWARNYFYPQDGDNL